MGAWLNMALWRYLFQAGVPLHLLYKCTYYPPFPINALSPFREWLQPWHFEEPIKFYEIKLTYYHSPLLLSTADV